MQTFHLIQVSCYNISIERAKNGPKVSAGKKSLSQSMRFTGSDLLRGCVTYFHFVLRFWLASWSPIWEFSLSHRTGQRSSTTSEAVSFRTTSPRSWRTTWRRWWNPSTWTRSPELSRALSSSSWTKGTRGETRMMCAQIWTSWESKVSSITQLVVASVFCLRGWVGLQTLGERNSQSRQN